MFLLIIILLYVAAFILSLVMPGTVETQSAVIAPLTIAGYGAAVSGVSKLLGGNKGGVPKWLENYLREDLRNDRTSAYTPNKEAFDAQTNSRIQDILAQLPANQEAFNANLASRGLFTAGEAPAAEYRDVIAPVTRAATSAAIQGQVGFERLRLAGVQAADRYRQNAAQLAIGATKGQRTGPQQFLDLISQGGDFAIKYGLMKELRLIDG